MTPVRHRSGAAMRPYARADLAHSTAAVVDELRDLAASDDILRTLRRSGARQRSGSLPPTRLAGRRARSRNRLRHARRGLVHRVARRDPRPRCGGVARCSADLRRPVAPPTCGVAAAPPAAHGVRRGTAPRPAGDRRHRHHARAPDAAPMGVVPRANRRSGRRPFGGQRRRSPTRPPARSRRRPRRRAHRSAPRPRCG